MATLKGKTILIVGGSSGIGYGVALASLQSEASKVIIASSSADKLAEAKMHLREEDGYVRGFYKGEIETKVLNAKDLDSVKSVVESIGEIDHLVFTSGDHLRITPFNTTSIATMKGLSSVFLLFV